MIDITIFPFQTSPLAISSTMLIHRVFSHRPPPFLRPQCTRHILRPQYPCHIRHSSFLPSTVLPPSLIRRRQKTVRKSKPLPISPSPTPRFRRKRRLVWYTLAFVIAGAVTYTALQPDNFVNHVFHGVVRCSRVTVALVHCVYDYRMTMRRKFEDEEDQVKDMSECHLRCARRALRVFEKNGGIYIKLGQHLAALSYLIPIVSPNSVLATDFRNGFLRCQYYKMPVHPLQWQHWKHYTSTT